MAHRLALGGNPDLPHVWNISDTVGDASSCRNAATDVRLVKILLFEWLRTAQPPIHPSCREPFDLRTGMNLRTAYWIRAVNQRHLSAPGGQALNYEQMGVFTPARAAGYGRDTWSIVRLNRHLKDTKPAVWRDMAAHPSADAALRRELA